MIASLAFLAVLGLSQASPALQIVGGEDAKLGEFPSAVSVRNGRFHICAGSLISDQWVLTQATCYSQDSNYDLSVSFGEVRFSNGAEDPNPDNIRLVSDRVMHPNFTVDGGADWILIRNDLALLKLESKVDLSANKNVAVAKLPSQGQKAPADVSSTVVGWGWLTPNNRQYPETLQKLDFELYNQTYCGSIFNKYNYSDSQNLCAGAATGKGVCPGDGGNPLIVDGVLWGLESWFINPCASGPTVLSNVAYFIDWIKAETGLNF